MPATPRKAPAKKSPTAAAVAARREVRAEGATPKPVKVPFRGLTFEIPRDRLGSARVYMRQRALSQFRTLDAVVDLLFELLGPADSSRFIGTCAEGDELDTVATEFLNGLNKAAGSPNS